MMTDGQTSSVPREQVHEAGGARVGFDQGADIVRATAGRNFVLAKTRGTQAITNTRKHRMRETVAYRLTH